MQFACSQIEQVQNKKYGCHLLEMIIRCISPHDEHRSPGPIPVNSNFHFDDWCISFSNIKYLLLHCTVQILDLCH